MGSKDFLVRFFIANLVFILVFIGLPAMANEAILEEDVSEPIVIGSGELANIDGKEKNVGFGYPYSLAYFEKTKSIIIADTDNHSIRSLDLETLEVTTLVGIQKGVDRFGLPGGGYEDGPVDKAMFNRPRGVAVAENGAIFVADTGNHAIRQIFEGKVTTIAGGKTPGYMDGKGIDASFYSPSSIVIDNAGNLLVADTRNDVIRKIDLEARVTTYAGKNNDNSILNEPVGLAIDNEGNLLVVDSGNHQLKKITSQGRIEVLAGILGEIDEESGYRIGRYEDGLLGRAAFNFPKSITLKDDGTIFLADTYNHAIRMIKGEEVATVMGAGVAGWERDERYLTYLDGPSGIVYAADKLIIADRWNNRILIVSDQGNNLAPIELIYDEAPKDGVLVYLNGRKLSFPDVQPLLEDGSPLIPVRVIGEALNTEVNWDEKGFVSIIKNEKTTELSLERSDFFLCQNRSMVNLETLSKELGLMSTWLKDQRVVILKTK